MIAPASTLVLFNKNIANFTPKMARVRRRAPSWGPIFNPAKNKYSWVDSGYLGISYQKEPSFIPSRIGNISDSYMSEMVNKYLSDQKILKDKVYEQKEGGK